MKIDRTLLKQLRLAKALSQEELAIAAGISTRTVQRMEAEGSASLESQKAIAAVFGIGAEQLLEKSVPPTLGDPMKVVASSTLLIAATIFAHLLRHRPVIFTNRLSGFSGHICGFMGCRGIGIGYSCRERTTANEFSASRDASLTIRSSRARFAASAERRKIVTLPWPRSGPA